MHIVTVKIVEEMTGNSETVTERIEHLRRQTLSDVAKLIATAIGSGQQDTARELCKTMWRMHRAGVTAWKQRKAMFLQSRWADVDKLIANERKQCRIIQMVVNKAGAAENTALPEKKVKTFDPQPGELR